MQKRLTLKERMLSLEIELKNFKTEVSNWKKSIYVLASIILMKLGVEAIPTIQAIISP